MLAKLNHVSIKSISTCVAKSGIPLYEYAPHLIDEKQSIKFAKNTGFSKLAISSENITTADLCLKAAKELFKKTDIKPNEIDALIFLTQTPNWHLPATSHYLQNELGLSNDVFCLDVNEGCAGYEHGLYLASLLVSSNQCENVLLLVGDTITKITDPSDKATRLIFGDAGSASVLSSSNSSIIFSITTYGDRYNAIITENSRHKITSETAKGFLHLDGMGIMDFTLNEVPECIEELLKYANYDKESIELFAAHQANKLILDSLAMKLGIPSAKMPFSAGEIGNTSSASIPVLLCKDYKEQKLGKVMLCGFGVGLACALCIADLSETKILDLVKYE